MKTILKILMSLSFSAVLSISLEAATVESLSVRIDKYMNLAQLYIQRAQLHINNKNFKAASFDLNRAILIDPSLEEAQLFLAEILIDEKHIQESKKLLINLVKTSKKKEIHAHAYLLLGDIYIDEGNIQEALLFYKKNLHKTTAYTQVTYIKVADAYYELGEFRQSIRVLKMGLNTMIEKDKIREKIVDLSIKEGHLTLALSVINERLKEHANKSKLYYQRAEILKEQGKIKEMQLEIKKAKLSLLKETQTLKAS